MTCSVDAHFVDLIRYVALHELLGSLRTCLTQQIELTQQMMNLNGPLNRLVESDIQSKRELKKNKKKKKESIVERLLLNDQEKKKSQKKKDASQKKILSVSQKNKLAAAERRSMNVKKRKEMWEANLAVGEYAIEQFVF